MVVTTVFSVMGSKPSARKLDSISSSLGVVLVVDRVRRECVDVSSVVGGGVLVLESGLGSVSLVEVSIAGAELL